MAMQCTNKRSTGKWLEKGLVSTALTCCLACCLTGCLGGTVAQQIARSVLMQGADKATAAALDAHDRNEKIAAQKLPLKDTAPDPYKIAFLNSGFEKVTIQVEPLPASSIEEEKPNQTIQEAQLVQVEVWNLLVGDEKQRILEKARIQGSAEIPPKDQWQLWQIAIGAADNKQSSNKYPITFLIPPEIGKMHSGEKVLVEISNIGELNIARYAVN
jgi:hypothetical protein